MKLALLIIMAIGLFTGCRKEIEDDAQLKTSSEVTWYDSLGNPGECEQDKSSCTEALDPIKTKAFIDACVDDKGGRARDCGCTIKCTSQWQFGELTAPKTLKTVRADESEPSCSEKDSDIVDRMMQIAIKDDSKRACAGAYLCEGKITKCDLPSSVEFARKLRAMSKGHCREQIVSSFCPTKFIDSLECPESSIEKLSLNWQTHIEGDTEGLKTCIQNTVCNNRGENCSPAGATKAKEIKKQLNQPGCAYWASHVCRL